MGQGYKRCEGSDPSCGVQGAWSPRKKIFNTSYLKVSIWCILREKSSRITRLYECIIKYLSIHGHIMLYNTWDWQLLSWSAGYTVWWCCDLHLLLVHFCLTVCLQCMAALVCIVNIFLTENAACKSLLTDLPENITLVLLLWLCLLAWAKTSSSRTCTPCIQLFDKHSIANFAERWVIFMPG